MAQLTAEGHYALAGWLLLLWRCNATATTAERLYTINDTLPVLRRYLRAKKQAADVQTIPLICKQLCEKSLHVFKL